MKIDYVEFVARGMLLLLLLTASSCTIRVVHDTLEPIVGW